jgi:Protein of unknown function (DUF2490)
MLRLTAPVLILSTLVQNLTFAQSARTDREVVNQSIEWVSYSSNIKVHKHVNLYVEGQFRFAGTFEPMQFQFRSAADLNINKKLSIVPLGYVYTWNPTYGKQPNTFVNNEHRIWEQVVFKHDVGRFHVSHRGRLEQRYIEVHVNTNGEIINQGYDYYANRFRYRLMVNVPFNKSEMGPKVLFASLYDEVFVSWGPHTTYHEPDQNRVFAGIGYQASKKFTITTGALYQMLVKANGAKQENNVGVQMTLAYNFDLTSVEPK